MPRLPRDIDGTDLVQKLSRFGYQPVRRTGSHIRLTYSSDGREHHITIPAHSPLKVGTLNAILEDVAAFLSMTKEEFLKQLF
jgi:predicted RNA binding protein YcfA (HicA-like mRNA interferase family)